MFLASGHISSFCSKFAEAIYEWRYWAECAFLLEFYVKHTVEQFEIHIWTLK